MKITSLVLRCVPERIEVLSGRLKAMPGVEVHGSDLDKGTVIATLEDVEGVSFSDALVAVNQLPDVQSMTIAYDYCDEGIEPRKQEA